MCAMARPGYLKFASWNPMFLTTAYRTEEIASFFKDFGVVALQGTCVKCWNGEQHHRQNTREHIVLHYGWKASPLVNKSAGCALMINRGRLGEQAIRRIRPAPQELLGRGGCTYLERGINRLNVIQGYFPPRPSQEKAVANWRICGKKLLDWITQMVLETPARFTPILCVDLNSGQGVRSKTACFDEAVGPFFPGGRK